MNDSGIKGKEYELTDLWHALKVERRLLLLAQENYRSLKTKFTQLTVDHEHLKETTAKVHQNYQTRLLSQIDESKESAQQLINEIDNEKVVREEQFQLFKSTTLEEIRTIYRTRLSSLQNEVSYLSKENRQLHRDNEKFHSELVQLQKQTEQIEREAKIREAQFKSICDAELLELSKKLQNQISESNVNELVAQLENAQTKIKVLEERVSQMNEEHSKEISMKHTKIDELLQQIVSMNSDKLIAEIRYKKLVVEKEKFQERFAMKEKEESDLRRNLTDLHKKKTEFESIHLAQENEQNIEWTARCTELETKLSKMQDQLMAKDQAIRELEKQFQHSDEAKASLIKEGQLQHEEKIRLSKKIDELEFKLREQSSEHANAIAQFRWEREKLDEKLAEVISSTNLNKYIVENERLKDQIRFKDRKFLELKENYRGLLSKMKHAHEKVEQPQK
uniref:Uncharacterized protein n=1 Tax=Acrobeloides nanus TaxID=290746 RepID=A0A914CJ41_9BILA